jgi:hypothetical protein
MEFLFEAISYAITPLTVRSLPFPCPSKTLLTKSQINVAELGTFKNAKPNTLAKRISTIAKRYNLAITSTTKVADGGGSIPVTPSKPRATPSKPAAGRKRKTPAKTKKESDEEVEDEGEVNGSKSDEDAQPNGKKQKTGDGEDADTEADVNGEEVAEGEELA